MTVPSRQEMFDRAVLGLRSQGWVRSVDYVGVCTYELPDGRRCAWGWVDPAGTSGRSGTILSLYNQRVGLLAELTYDVVNWAYGLQGVHDAKINNNPSALECAMRAFAALHGLTFPEVGDEPSA